MKSLLALLAFLLVLTSACEALKPATNPDRTDRREDPRDRDDLDPVQSRRVYDPETGTYVYVQNAPTEVMDTIEWTTVSEDRMPPIVEDNNNPYTPPTTTTTPNRPTVTQIGTGNNNSRKLSSYNVEMALPFLSNRYYGSEDGVDPNSLWSLHFYSGAQMAFEEMRSAGRLPSDFYVNVDDTNADAATTQSLVNSSDFAGAQLVIGPYVRANVTSMAEAARTREQVLVSPFSAATGISRQNPNYVQVNPTLNTHFRNLLDHAMRTQNADRIVLVTDGTSAQRPRLDRLQEDYKLLSNNANIQPLEEVTIDISNAEGDQLNQYLTGRKTVFIVPVYEDESFVANFLRQLYTVTRDDFGRNVAVYGLPQWMNFTRINFDYYEGTNVHVSASTFIDMLDPAVRSFKRDFYDRFGALPREEAFVGYDVTRYFLRMMAQYGTRFQYDLPANPETLLHTKFQFEPVVDVPPGATVPENAPIDRFENKYVNILQFRDYTFRRVN